MERARWACAVLGYASGLVPESEVYRYGQSVAGETEVGPGLREDETTGTAPGTAPPATDPRSDDPVIPTMGSLCGRAV